MGQLEDMGVFVRVVEAGGISRAAEQLGLAKSALVSPVCERKVRWIATGPSSRLTAAIKAGRNFARPLGPSGLRG